MRKWILVSSVLQIIFGIGAVVAYAALAASGEPVGKWTVTLCLAIAMVLIGSVNLIGWGKKDQP